MCTHFSRNDGEDMANRLLEESTVQELDQNFDLGRYGLDLRRRHHRKSIASLPFLLRSVSSSHLSSFSPPSDARKISFRACLMESS